MAARNRTGIACDSHDGERHVGNEQDTSGGEMSLPSLETWAYWLTVTAIVLPILGGVAAVFALVFSSRAAAIRDEALAKFQSAAKVEIASAQARAADLEPRQIIGQQRDQLVVALQQATSKGPVEINGVLGDSEAMMLGFQIESMLSDTGWEIVDSRLLATDAVGISLQVRSTTDEPPHALALRRAFESAGVTILRSTHSTVPPARVRIVVGSKAR